MTGSVEDTAAKFACSMGFSTIVIKWCDHHIGYVTGSGNTVTKYTHSRVVYLRLKDIFKILEHSSSKIWLELSGAVAIYSSIA